MRRRRASRVPSLSLPRSGRRWAVVGSRRRRPPARLHRARHGQVRRRRAQLFERHRPHRLLRSRSHRACAGTASRAAFFVRLTRDLVQLLEERTRRRLRLPHRSAPAPRSGRDASSRSRPRAALGYYESFGQNWERAALIKARPCAGDIEAGESSSRARAVHLAQIPRLRGHRRHPRDEAADPRPSRPSARSRSPATTSSSAAAASARSSSSCRRSS